MKNTSLSKLAFVKSSVVLGAEASGYRIRPMIITKTSTAAMSILFVVSNLLTVFSKFSIFISPSN